MTPTQIARRSDALYADGTCGMTRRVLCDMVAQREADIEDAKAENAKLREQGERLFNKVLELGTENSKLWELVRDMWHLMDGSGVTTGAWGRCVQILDRMRELGIEVD